MAIFVLCFLMLEAIGLLVLWQQKRRGLPPSQTIAFLGAGIAFGFAVLIVSIDGSPLLLAAALGIAFLFHLSDIWLRWRN